MVAIRHFNLNCLEILPNTQAYPGHANCLHPLGCVIIPYTVHPHASFHFISKHCEQVQSILGPHFCWRRCENESSRSLQDSPKITWLSGGAGTRTPCIALFTEPEYVSKQAWWWPLSYSLTRFDGYFHKISLLFLECLLRPAFFFSRESLSVFRWEKKSF